jgi:LPS sulfotransferase NodH
MATKTSKVKITPEKIEEAYLKHLLTQGKTPNSVFQFADDLGITEAKFYEHFSSFESIEKNIWERLIT